MAYYDARRSFKTRKYSLGYEKDQEQQKPIREHQRIIPTPIQRLSESKHRLRGILEENG